MFRVDADGGRSAGPGSGCGDIVARSTEHLNGRLGRTGLDGDHSEVLRTVPRGRNTALGHGPPPAAQASVRLVDRQMTHALPPALGDATWGGSTGRRLRRPRARRWCPAPCRQHRSRADPNRAASAARVRRAAGWRQRRFTHHPRSTAEPGVPEGRERWVPASRSALLGTKLISSSIGGFRY